jgi:uncharacterized membrane protein YeaQ/YmgE (transglycosylase-associated protein family)
MTVFNNILGILRTAISGLGDLVSWFVNFSFDFGGWAFDFLGFHFDIPSFHVNSGVLLTAGFIGAVVVLLIIHLVNVVTG